MEDSIWKTLRSFSDGFSCLFSQGVHTEILLMSVMVRCATLTDHLLIVKSSFDLTPMVSYIFHDILNSSSWPLHKTNRAFSVIFLTVGGSTNQSCHGQKIINRKTQEAIKSTRQHHLRCSAGNEISHFLTS